MNGTLALLHGFTGGPQSFDGVVAALPGTLRVIRPWLLGHGPDPELWPASFDAEVDRVAHQLAPHAERGPLLLCGYSLGGRVALGLLARHPWLFRGAVLVGARTSLLDGAERAARVLADERKAEQLEQEGTDAFVEAWERLPIFDSQRALAPEAREAQRRLRSSHDARGLARSLRVLGLGQMPDHRAALASLSVPVTLIAGELDEKFTALARELAQDLPHSDLRIAAGAGHNVLLERPDVVIEAIDRQWRALEDKARRRAVGGSASDDDEGGLASRSEVTARWTRATP